MNELYGHKLSQWDYKWLYRRIKMLQNSKYENVQKSEEKVRILQRKLRST